MKRNRGFQEPYKNEEYIQSIFKRFPEYQSKNNIDLVELLNRNSNKDYYNKEKNTTIIKSSHPEIELKLIQFYENNYNTNNLGSNYHFFSDYKNLFDVFKEISPIYLENLSLSWYDVNKEGLKNYDRRMPYSQLIRAFTAYNDSLHINYWLELGKETTTSYGDQTKKVFETYIKENFTSINWNDALEYLQSILTEEDKKRIDKETVNIMNASRKSARKEEEKLNRIFRNNNIK